MIFGPYNCDLFKSFIERYLYSYFRIHCDSILIMDNCRFHHRTDVLRLLNEHHISYKFLPPYSPHLNPIEEFFSMIKARYNSIRPKPSTVTAIKLTINNILGTINAPLNSFFARARSFLDMH